MVKVRPSRDRHEPHAATWLGINIQSKRNTAFMVHLIYNAQAPTVFADYFLRQPKIIYNRQYGFILMDKGLSICATRIPMYDISNNSSQNMPNGLSVWRDAQLIRLWSRKWRYNIFGRLVVALQILFCYCRKWKLELLYNVPITRGGGVPWAIIFRRRKSIVPRQGSSS